MKYTFLPKNKNGQNFGRSFRHFHSNMDCIPSSCLPDFHDRNRWSDPIRHTHVFFVDCGDYCSFRGICDRCHCVVQKKRSFRSAHNRHFIVLFDQWVIAAVHE